VYVFFGLSGFLISRPFVRAFTEDRRLPNVRRYLRRRAFRIAPIYYLAVTLILLRYGVKGQSATDVLSMYTFTTPWTFDGPLLQNYLAPAWSLHVEIGFYLLIPLVALALTRAIGPRGSFGSRTAVVVGLAAAVAAGSLALVDILPHTVQGFRQVPVNLFPFMSGVALAARSSRQRSRWSGPAGGRGERW
jgi:acetyltransferase